MKLDIHDLEIRTESDPRYMSNGVWVIHKPTGFKAYSEHYQSQLKNKEAALSMIEWATAGIE